MHEILKRVAPDFIENIRELNRKVLKEMSEDEEIIAIIANSGGTEMSRANKEKENK